MGCIPQWCSMTRENIIYRLRRPRTVVFMTRKPLSKTEQKKRGMDHNGFVRRFMFATGIENSYPTIALPDGRTKRVDEMEKTLHYERWRDDFELVKELGIEYLRYGPPYYKCHVAPGKYDWSFADETFNALHKMEITPIADLCHFG